MEHRITQIMEAMTSSISEVMESMFFMPADIGPEALFKDAQINPNDALACRLSFTGDISGNLVIVSPDSLVSELASNFMGESKDQLSWEQQCGTLTEMLNMVCGNALRKIKSKLPFALGLPEMIACTDLNDTLECQLIEIMDERLALILTMDAA